MYFMSLLKYKTFVNHPVVMKLLHDVQIIASISSTEFGSASHNSLASVMCIYTSTRRSIRTLRIHPTKRVVVFSNSFCFSAMRSPSGFPLLI
ncbi:hypothetical protein EE612_049649 [Oryza sativa]|nr:hypothetical protein EE612_049649 [Oryza sativa]